MRLFMAAILEFIRSWWHVDRIRISPREGRLLRITPGSMVCVVGTVWEITRRSVHDTCDGPFVRYECRGPESDSEMWIATAPKPMIRWICRGEQSELMPDEIGVWTPALRANVN